MDLFFDLNAALKQPNGQSPTSYFEKCIDCYQKDISLLKQQNQECEQIITILNEPITNLLHSYKMLQNERDQIFKENVQLKKKTYKKSKYC